MGSFGIQVIRVINFTLNTITSARGRFYSFRTTEMRIRPMTTKEQRDMASSDKGPMPMG